MKKKRIIIIAVLVCFAAILFAYQTLLKQSPNRFSSYQIPVLSMTAQDCPEEIEVRRQLEMDVSEMGKGLTRNAKILDTYDLTNNSQESVTLELVLPFLGQLSAYKYDVPQITVNGEEIAATLNQSHDPDQKVRYAGSFEAIRNTLQTYDYLSQAQEDAPGWDEPVIVYEISGLDYKQQTDQNLFYTLSFESDPAKTTVWKYGSISWGQDKDSGRDFCQFHVPKDQEYWVQDHGYLLIQGEDIQSVSAKGSAFGAGIPSDGRLDEKYNSDNVVGEIRRYESTLEEMVWKLAQEYASQREYDQEEPYPAVTPELLYHGAMIRMRDGVADAATNSYHSISEVFYAVVWDPNMMYWVLPVEIPAGETVRVAASYFKGASMNLSIFREKEKWSGFEIAPCLNSRLNFVSQTLMLRGLDRFTEIDSNLDISATSTAALDLDTERYYLNLKS